MTANVRVKKDRPRYFIVLEFKDENGNKKRKWITTEFTVKGGNKRKVKEYCQELLEKYKRNEINTPTNVLFADYLLEWLKVFKTAIAPTTHANYLKIINADLRPYFKNLNVTVGELNRERINKYINLKLKSLSPNTVIQHLTVISKCADSAIKSGLICSNPTKLVERPKRVKFKEVKFLTVDEIEPFLKVFEETPLYDIVLFTLFYGLRKSEVLGLKWNAIDIRTRMLTIRHTVVRMGKEIFKLDSVKNNASHRAYPIPKFLLSRLEAIKEEQEYYKSLQPNDYKNEGYVFTKYDGSLRKPDSVAKSFQKILQKNGLPKMRFHDLRHSCATYLLSKGFNLKQIQDWLGHGKIATTMDVYAHLDINSKKIISDLLACDFERLL